MTLQFALSMQRVGVSRPHNATHDSRHFLQCPKRLALFIGGGASVSASLCNDPASTLDDLREAVSTLEDTERTARRVLGGANPLTTWIEEALRNARAALRARETPSPGRP